ncbi:MAG TPA: hypothetical protein VK545_05045 [Streptomyces sp.]|nr:hypothetical protein [Streptomyces sp.]
MLQIGMHGLAFVLTIATIGAVKKGGKTLPPPAGLVIGMVLAYAYRQAGDPWAVLSDQAAEMNGRIGDEFGVLPAAISLGILAGWHFVRPGLLTSTILGFFALTAASAASELWVKAVSIFGSIITVIAG